MKRSFVAVCLVIAGLGGMGVTSHSVALAASGGNSDAAHMCQQGGYLALQGSDGTTFKNEGQCVSYAARGGTIVGVSACTVDSTTGCLTFNNATLVSDEGTGNSITLTGTTSFVDTFTDTSNVDVCTTGHCDFSVPNNLATGGGTYTETDSTGAVTSSGTYRIANTAGWYEGLSYLEYLDGTGAFAPSCALATGKRYVGVFATLIDTTTGATQTVAIDAATGPYAGGNVGVVQTATDFFAGNVSSSALTITC